jgi:uncharacterized protein YkwD
MRHLLFIVSIFIAFQGSAKNTWKPSDYKRYSIENIEKFPQITQRIVPEDIDIPLLNAAIFYETNRERKKHGLPQFQHSSKLERLAMGHSEDMVKYHFFSHYSRAPGKKTLDDRLKKVGLQNVYAGENIAEFFLLEIGENEPFYPPSQFGYFKNAQGDTILLHTYIGLAKEVVKGWMNSPGHRANILNKKFTHMGIGNALYYDGGGIDKVARVKITQNFGKL